MKNVGFVTSKTLIETFNLKAWEKNTISVHKHPTKLTNLLILTYTTFL